MEEWRADDSIHRGKGKSKRRIEEKEIDGAVAVCRGEAEGSEIVGNPVRAGLDEFRVGRGGAQREDAGACGLAGADTGGGGFPAADGGGGEGPQIFRLF